MRRRVYRSLDRRATFFGIRGRFLWLMALGAALALIIGMTVGAVTSTAFGIGAGMIVATIAYLVTTTIQSTINEKDIWKIVIKRGYPSLYRVHPKHIRNLWRGFNFQRGKPSRT